MWVLAFDGRRQAARHNNQLTVGGRNRGDVEEEAQPGWIAWGGTITLLGATKCNDRKNERDGWGLGLRRLPINVFPHNNQPKSGLRDGGEYEGEVGLGGSAQRGCLSIVLAALSSNNIIQLT